jgi:hypothetical protein
MPASLRVPQVGYLQFLQSIRQDLLLIRLACVGIKVAPLDAVNRQHVEESTA